MKEIVDHRSNATAISKDDGFVISSGGNRTAKRTTRGWELCVEWKDGTSDWVKLKDLKDSNPVELAEYAVANLIVNELAFKWWVPLTLKKRNRVIAKVKSQYLRTTHKFGIRVPKSIEEAYRIDEENGNSYWADALKKEFSKVSVAWEAYGKGLTPEEVRAGKAPDLIGFHEIGCHMIFDVKMSDLSRKCRFVAGGHTTEAPASLTYSSVVSRDSLRIAFLIAALNDLDVQACDVIYAYLNAPCCEKIWFEGGAECGEDCGKVMNIKRALYGLRSSGAAWRNMLAAMMAPYSALPRVGHIEALYNIFTYLMMHDESALAFDATKPDIDESAFQEVDWKDFYGEVEEELPPKMPEPLGRPVTISCFVDANHAGNVVTRWSHSGVLIFLMNAPIIWFSKRQNTVESSSFGSEFVAARIARDLIVSLRIKLRMFGCPIDGPANVFCDNQGVVKNASLLESTLSKKHNAINYHVVREAAAAGILRF